MTQTRQSGRSSDHQTTDHLAAMAHDTVDRVAEAANHAETGVRSAAARTTRQVKDLQDQAMETADENMKRVRTYVKKNPLTATGIAFAAGVVLSAIFRR
jgi:ElaB/YqjD/DUF883 family membrane-anchored ribosome-binding protein